MPKVTMVGAFKGAPDIITNLDIHSTTGNYFISEPKA